MLNGDFRCLLYRIAQRFSSQNGTLDPREL
jgi:hypothetical protein